VAFISLVVSILMFLYAPDIAACFSGGKYLVWILKIFAIGLPFAALSNLTLGAMRGFKNLRDFVLVQNLFIPGSELIVACSILFIIQKNVNYLTAGYVICFAASCLLGLILLFRSSWVFGKWKSIKSENNGREILNFSLPLFGSDILGSFRYRADAIFLGYMMSVTEVGLYYVCIPIARALQLVMTSINKIFMPSMSELYSKRDIEDLQHIYGRVSLWIFYATLPLFLIICLFPEIILGALFGEKYISSSKILIILSFGFFINAASGPFGETFVAIGRPNLNMFTSVISLAVNISLIIILIPTYGLHGAAIAATVSLLCACLFGAGMLYYYSKLHPFRKEHIKSILSISLPFVLLSYILNLFPFNMQIWLLPIFIVLVYSASFISLIIFGCFDEHELTVFRSIFKRLIISSKKNIIKLS
jgi:O-antigen/teichoic acid export membrane protein